MRSVLATTMLFVAAGTSTLALAAPRLHPLKAYTVEYKQEGMQVGTVIEHSRNYGNQRSETTDATTNMMGMSIRHHQRVITEGNKITTLDLTKGTATQTTNPLYDSIAASMQGKDPVEAGKAMLTAMGGAPTGTSQTIAGETCQDWKLAQLGQDICVTSDGLTLLVRSNMAGISMTRTAVKVTRGDGGPDAAFELPKGVKATQAPNIQQLMQQMRPPASQ